MGSSGARATWWKTESAMGGEMGGVPNGEDASVGRVQSLCKIEALEAEERRSWCDGEGDGDDKIYK